MQSVCALRSQFLIPEKFNLPKHFKNGEFCPNVRMTHLLSIIHQAGAWVTSQALPGKWTGDSREDSANVSLFKNSISDQKKLYDLVLRAYSN